MSLPNWTGQSASDYKNSIDAAIAQAAAFWVAEQSTPDMTALVAAGNLHNVDTDSHTIVAAQNTATITAPNVNPRRDIVYIDEGTGTVGVATGAEAASPSDPAVPTGKIPLARISLTTSTTTITDTEITNFPPRFLNGFLKSDSDGSGLTGISTGDQTARNMAIAALVEANASGVAGTKGPLVLVDPFTSDTLDTSTNATYDATNDLYANDAETAGTWAESQTLTRDFGDGATNGRHTGQRFVQSGAKSVKSITIRTDTAAGSGSFNAKARFYTDNSGSPGTLVGTASDAVLLSVEDADKTFTFSTPVALSDATAYWLVLSDEDLGGSASVRLEHCADQGANYGSGNHDTLTSITSTVSTENRFQISYGYLAPTMSETGDTLDTADPTDLSAYCLFNFPDADVTVSSDITVNLSIDGGTTKAAATGTKVTPDGSVDELWRFDADVSAQTGSTPFIEVIGPTKQIQWKQNGGVLPVY